MTVEIQVVLSHAAATSPMDCRSTPPKTTAQAASMMARIICGQGAEGRAFQAWRRESAAALWLPAAVAHQERSDEAPHLPLCSSRRAWEHRSRRKF